MDKTKLKELIKEEVQALLSEASASDKYTMIDRTISELEKGAAQDGISAERAKAMAAGLRDIVKQLRGELNEAEMRGPFQRLQDIIQSLNSGVSVEAQRELAKQLIDISDELRYGK